MPTKKSWCFVRFVADLLCDVFGRSLKSVGKRHGERIRARSDIDRIDGWWIAAIPIGVFKDKLEGAATSAWGE